MKSKLLHAHAGQKTYAVVFDKGEEAVAGLNGFVRGLDIGAASLTAIGAFNDVTLGYFDRSTNSYRKIPVREQVEVLSLIGGVAEADGEPTLHAHVVVGLADGTTRGGHLLEGHVWPTLEVTLVELPAHLHKRVDPETGLALIRIRD